jgi:hypothetical protein
MIRGRWSDLYWNEMPNVRRSRLSIAPLRTYSHAQHRKEIQRVSVLYTSVSNILCRYWNRNDAQSPGLEPECLVRWLDPSIRLE